MSEKLPTWDREGHLTEIALVALADGQHDLLEEKARAHAGTCEACANALADLALQSIAVGDAMMYSRRKLPVAAIAVAIALALIGIVPSLLEPGSFAALFNAPHSLPMFASAFVSAVRTLAQSTTGTLTTFAAALLLLVSGALVARKRATTVRSS